MDVTSGFPVLSWLGIIPLVGAAVVFALPDMAARQTKIGALVFGVGTLLASLGVAVAFDGSRAQEQQFAEVHHWMPQLGVSWAMGLNGISLVMVLLTTVVTVPCMLAAFREFHDRPDKMQFFLALMLALEGLVIWVFMARDLFLFYVLFEVMLIPMYFMIGMAGGVAARAAATRFLLYNLAAGLVMLVSVIAMSAFGSGPEAYLIDNLAGSIYGGAWTERWLFLGIFLAFAVKAPIWPAHAWLPDAATAGTPSTAVMISAVMDKVGTFGMLVILLPLFPNASRWAAPVVVTLALISVIYGALVAIGQRNLQRMIAYTSISHFGFIVMGIFALTSTGSNGSVLYMVNHGFSTAALFLVAGMFISRYRTADIADYGGMQRVLPVLSGVFLLAGLSALAMPGMSTFVSEFMVLTGTFQRYRIAAIIGSLGIVLAALYILWVYQRMATGPVREELRGRPDLRPREAWIAVPLLALIIGFGFYPKPMLDVVVPAVGATMTQSQITDPAPVLEGSR